MKNNAPGTGIDALWIDRCAQQVAQPGTLYVLGTPLGNLGDLTLRAVQMLKTCDCIACETPNITQHLLSAVGITHKRLFTYRDAGELKSAQQLLGLLQQKKSIALVSDAGTPTISDPGYRLIKLCREQDIPVLPIPGPCAALTALSVSGFPSHNFLFLGFLPLRPGPQKKLLMAYQTFQGTLIIYESPYRIATLLGRLSSIFEPERQIFIAREMTKLNETYYRFPLKDWMRIAWPERGEYVLLIAPQALD